MNDQTGLRPRPPSVSPPTWERIRQQLRSATSPHRSSFLPCDVAELRWIRSEAGRVIDYFDGMYWSIVELAGWLESASAGDNGTEGDARQLTRVLDLPSRQSRLDALLGYLTPDEWIDFRIAQQLSEIASRELRKTSLGQGLGTTTASHLGHLLRGWAAGVRRGSIVPLGQLERRAVLLLDLLTSVQFASDAQPKSKASRGRGRPANPVNEARDKQLRVLCEQLEDQLDGVTPQRLLEAARQDVLIQELVSRFGANLTYEVCRNTISPVRHRRARDRKKHQDSDAETPPVTLQRRLNPALATNLDKDSEFLPLVQNGDWYRGK